MQVKALAVIQHARLHITQNRKAAFCTLVIFLIDIDKLAVIFIFGHTDIIIQLREQRRNGLRIIFMVYSRRTEVQLRLILTQIKLLIDKLLQLLIKLLNLLMRRAVHNNSKLHAVQAEELCLLVQQLQHLLRKIMQHEVACLIAIDVVDNVELADADDKNIHRLMLLLLFGNILKKLERIAKICYRVNRINRAMVGNRTHENIRLLALALEHIAVTAAHYIIALRIARPVLHFMISLFAAHDGADIA